MIIEQLLLGVVIGATDVLVAGGLRRGRSRRGQWLLVVPLLEQVEHGAAVECAQLSAADHRFQARITVLAGQREQAQAGAIAHLQVRFVG